MLTLIKVKEFLRIEHSEEDALLTSLIGSTEAYLVSATIKSVDLSSELFKNTQLFLIAHWYEKRELEGKGHELGHHLNSMILQLTYQDSVLSTQEALEEVRLAKIALTNQLNLKAYFIHNHDLAYQKKGDYVEKPGAIVAGQILEFDGTNFIAGEKGFTDLAALEAAIATKAEKTVTDNHETRIVGLEGETFVETFTQIQADPLYATKASEHGHINKAELDRLGLDIDNKITVDGTIINVKGDTGLTGPTGPTGPAGTNGIDGAQGIKGDAGLTGPAGTAGADGLQGPQGLQGETGLTGPTGPQGLTGPAGTNGIDGLDGSIIVKSATAPVDLTVYWWNTTTNILNFHDGVSWIAHTTGTGGTPTVVEDSATNGSIVVDGVELVVYAHPTTHAIAEVADLQTALDGKAASTHDHAGTYQPAGTYVEKPGIIANAQVLVWDELAGAFVAGDQAAGGTTSGVSVYPSLADAPIAPVLGDVIATVAEDNFYVYGDALSDVDVVYDIPALTANIDQGFTMTRSSTASPGNPYHAFDKVDKSYWKAATTTNEWLGVEFPEKHVITGFLYDPYTQEAQVTYGPKDLDFIGVNDDLSEDVLLSIRDRTDWGNGSLAPHFVVSNTKAYKKYKFFIFTGNNATVLFADKIIFDEKPMGLGWVEYDQPAPAVNQTTLDALGETAGALTFNGAEVGGAAATAKSSVKLMLDASTVTTTSLTTGLTVTGFDLVTGDDENEFDPLTHIYTASRAKKVLVVYEVGFLSTVAGDKVAVEARQHLTGGATVVDAFKATDHANGYNITSNKMKVLDLAAGDTLTFYTLGSNIASGYYHTDQYTYVDIQEL